MFEGGGGKLASLVSLLILSVCDEQANSISLTFADLKLTNFIILIIIKTNVHINVGPKTLTFPAIVT